MTVADRNRRSIMIAAGVIYALGMLAAGAIRLWHRPLDWDDTVHYLPAIRLFAASFPRVLLHYPMPMPPFALFVEGAIYHFSNGSVAAVRSLSTFCSIAMLVTVMWHLGRETATLGRSLLFAAFFGSATWFPAFGFSLKHYAIASFFLVAGWVFWERRMTFLAVLTFILATLTVQMAVAFVVVLLFIERRDRRALVLLLPLAAIGCLALVWHGMQPPEFESYPGKVRWLGMYPEQVLVAAFVLGTSVVPLIDGWWRKALVCLPAVPLLVWLLDRSSILVVRATGDRLSMAGSALAAVRMAVRGSYGLTVAGVAILCAVGLSLPVQAFVIRSRETLLVTLYSAVYAAMMVMFVSFFVERYYAFLVVVAWLVMSRVIVQSRSALVAAFQLAVIAGSLLHVCYSAAAV